MRYVGHVAHMGEIRNAYTILVGKHEEKNYLGNLGVDERTIFKGISKK
jgi:hypothetical protein